MTDKIICEKCGSEMKDYSSGNSIVIKCTKCGWGWAATTYDPTDDDSTEYEIWLCPGNVCTKDAIRLIADIADVNYIQAKRMLESKTAVMIFKAKQEAIASRNKVHRIQDTAKKLKEFNIGFFVVPDFPYEL